MFLNFYTRTIPQFIIIDYNKYDKKGKSLNITKIIRVAVDRTSAFFAYY